MSKKTRLCPFRKTSEQRTDSTFGQTTTRERFVPCLGHRCMAYVYTAPIINVDSCRNPNNWGCAKMLNCGTDIER